MLAASRNKIRTLKGFPHLPVLEVDFYLILLVDIKKHPFYLCHQCLI